MAIYKDNKNRKFLQKLLNWQARRFELRDLRPYF